MDITIAHKEPEIAYTIVSAAMASQPTRTKEDRKLVNLVKSFSWYLLSEISHSTLSGLKGYYGRAIMNEMDQPSPRQDKIDHCHAQMDTLAAIERDSSNFMTRERMEEIIIRYAPALKLTS